MGSLGSSLPASDASAATPSIIVSSYADGVTSLFTASYTVQFSVSTDYSKSPGTPLPVTLPVTVAIAIPISISVPSTTSAGTGTPSSTSGVSTPSSIGITASTASVSPTIISQSAVSTSLTAPTTGGSRTAPAVSASSSSVAAPPTPGKSSSNTGYIAAIAVLAVLLGIAILGLAFVHFRKRRSPKHAESVALMNDEAKAHSEPKAQIVALERQLHDRDNQLRTNQAALLQQGRSVASDTLDDRQVSQRFAQVNKSIRDWVVGNFKSIPGNLNVSRDTATLLQRTQPNYRAMLEDPRTKYIVLRSLVAEVLVQAFKSGELLGSPAYSELDAWVKEDGAPNEISDWRTLTMTLLEKSPAYRTERASSVQEISKRISFLVNDVAGVSYSELRATQMQKIVESVATLVSELTSQRSTYDLGMEKGPFDPVSMEDALQDYGEEKLLGKHVQCVVFPAVKKWEDGVARTSQARILSKAQVLT